MSNSVASSRVGRSGSTKKYNIAPEFLTSPYLSKPIGAIDHDKRSKRKARRRGPGESDAESVASFRTHRSVSSYRTQQIYRRPAQNSMSLRKNTQFLLPREMDKLLRGFRQKHSSRAAAFPGSRQPDAGYLGGGEEDDTSTIASDFAESLDDKDVYLHCRKDPEVLDSLFSSPLFSDLTIRNATKERTEGPIVTLPPVGTIDRDKSLGDISDLESVASRRRR